MGESDFDSFFFADRVNKHTLERIKAKIAPGGFSPQGYLTSPKCLICNHLLRPQVEEMIYAGCKPNLVNAFVEEMGYKSFPVSQIKHHAQEHCPVLSVSRELAKRNHQDRVKQLSDEMLSGSEALNTIINIAMQKVEEGSDLKVKAGDVIKAVETKNKLEGNVPLLDVMAKLFERKEAEVYEGETAEEDEDVVDAELEEDFEFFEEEGVQA